MEEVEEWPQSLISLGKVGGNPMLANLPKQRFSEAYNNKKASHYKRNKPTLESLYRTTLKLKEQFFSSKKEENVEEIETKEETPSITPAYNVMIDNKPAWSDVVHAGSIRLLPPTMQNIPNLGDYHNRNEYNNYNPNNMNPNSHGQLHGTNLSHSQYGNFNNQQMNINQNNFNGTMPSTQFPMNQFPVDEYANDPQYMNQNQMNNYSDNQYLNNPSMNNGFNDLEKIPTYLPQPAQFSHMTEPIYPNKWDPSFNYSNNFTCYYNYYLADEYLNSLKEPAEASDTDENQSNQQDPSIIGISNKPTLAKPLCKSRKQLQSGKDFIDCNET